MNYGCVRARVQWAPKKELFFNVRPSRPWFMRISPRTRRTDTYMCAHGARKYEDKGRDERIFVEVGPAQFQQGSCILLGLPAVIPSWIFYVLFGKDLAVGPNFFLHWIKKIFAGLYSPFSKLEAADASDIT